MGLSIACVDAALTVPIMICSAAASPHSVVLYIGIVTVAAVPVAARPIGSVFRSVSIILVVVRSGWPDVDAKALSRGTSRKHRDRNGRCRGEDEFVAHVGWLPIV